MPLLRSDVESVLIRRCGQRMTLCRLDGTTIDGTNLDLNDPIRNALKMIGLPTAASVTVADADLATITYDDQVEQLLLWAELRTLETILENWVYVDTVIGETNTRRLDQIAAQTAKRIEAINDKIENQRGEFSAGCAAGRVRRAHHTGLLNYGISGRWDDGRR